jgi:ABC-2 type transport system ATP-binding protein
MMIEIKDLLFKYAKQEKLFADFSIHLEMGKIYGLLGKNGAGKTTLLKLIMGLLFPQKGTCQVLELTPRSRLPVFLSQVYFIPEEFYLPPITITKYLDLYSSFYVQFNRNTFSDLMENFDLPANEKLSRFSYGQKKKFLTIFGLATNAKLFIFDEPTNGLDIPSKSLFRKLIASSLTKDRTVIISTHQARDLGNLIDHLVILEDGDLILDESIYEISNRLVLRMQHDPPKENENILYWEQTLGGYAVVKENDSGDDSLMDLEILFNTIASNKDKIHTIFNKESKIAK